VPRREGRAPSSAPARTVSHGQCTTGFSSGECDDRKPMAQDSWVGTSPNYSRTELANPAGMSKSQWPMTKSGEGGARDPRHSAGPPPAIGQLGSSLSRVPGAETRGPAGKKTDELEPHATLSAASWGGEGHPLTPGAGILQDPEPAVRAADRLEQQRRSHAVCQAVGDSDTRDRGRTSIAGRRAKD
jgi:hypothetical protein